MSPERISSCNVAGTENTTPKPDPALSDSGRKAWFNEALRKRLQAITNSSSNRSPSRSLQMVMSAVRSPTYRTQLVNELEKGPTGPSHQPTFTSQMRKFFSSLDVQTIDPYTTTVKVLRHEFEKVKARKLSSDEKRLFKRYATEFFESRVMGERSYSEGRTPCHKPIPPLARAVSAAQILSQTLSAISTRSPDGIVKLCSTPPSPNVSPMNPEYQVVNSTTCPVVTPKTTIVAPNRTSLSVITLTPGSRPLPQPQPARSRHLGEVLNGLTASTPNNTRTAFDIKATPFLAKTVSPKSTRSQPAFNPNHTTPLASIKPLSASQPPFARSGSQRVKRKSTALTRAPTDPTSPRSEVIPELPTSKRPIVELLSDDEDLYLPVSKAARTSTQQSLSIQELLSSDEEVEDKVRATEELNGAFLPGVNQINYDQAGSESDDSLPEITVNSPDDGSSPSTHLHAEPTKFSSSQVTQAARSLQSAQAPQSARSPRLAQTPQSAPSPRLAQASSSMADQASITCPLCFQEFPSASIQVHVESCLIE